MEIRDIAVATVRASLPEAIRFGDWVMPHREFALVRVRDADGLDGFAFTLTREGPVAATIRQAILACYEGARLDGVDDAASLFHRCVRSNLAGLSSGIGLRALSIVDLAVHDVLARRAGTPIARFLGGTPRPMPVTAIVGYPPSLPPEALAEEVRSLHEAGWRRFKVPIALPLERARLRLIAAREAAGDEAWLGLDAAWVFSAADKAADFVRSVGAARLDWIEDMFPPGCARLVHLFRELAPPGITVAMGDEQGGSYYPEALLQANAVDAVRVDLTCMGGITGARRIIDECREREVEFAPHMFAHVHSQVLAGWGLTAPIEWGVPGTGVDQFADSLVQPVVRDGLMEPLSEAPGFGFLANPGWLAKQPREDPDGIVPALMAAA